MNVLIAHVSAITAATMTTPMMIFFRIVLFAGGVTTGSRSGGVVVDGGLLDLLGGRPHVANPLCRMTVVHCRNQ